MQKYTEDFAKVVQNAVEKMEKHGYVISSISAGNAGTFIDVLNPPIGFEKLVVFVGYHDHFTYNLEFFLEKQPGNIIS